MNYMKHMKNKLDIFLRGGGQKEFKDMNRQELLEFLQHKEDSLAYENDINAEWLKRNAELEKDTFDYKKSFLYPHVVDPNFNEKIAQKKEFNDTKDDNQIHDVKEESKKKCNKKDFELMNHQVFVRNFLSFQTPYNNLLLYHGLGTGKTCSAIGVCEEMRDYLKQIGINKRIIIIASPNVQDNFKLQLFDERKLTNSNGIWSMNACIGNKFLKEVNTDIPKKKIVRQIKRIINKSYLFLGYEQFSNYINRKISDTNKKRGIRKIKREFSNRLIVIDEVHNIRSTDDSPHKQVSINLMSLVKHTDNLKLLLLSATPMYNSYKEIIWLMNLMNLNDGRFPVKHSDIFDKEGHFKTDDKGNEVGKELLIQKSTGYVSYIRGENPYSFPFRIWPTNFNKKQSILHIDYPEKQMNDVEIDIGIELLDVFVTKIGPYQKKAYDFAIESIKNSVDDDIEIGMGYQVLEKPIQILNIVYPHEGLEDGDEISDRLLYGKGGLDRVMNMDNFKNFKYKKKVLAKYGRIFSQTEIGKYSGKIKAVCDSIKNAKGLVLVYSQYISGGCVPIALALEEMGFNRYGGGRFFKDKPDGKMKASYVMITGDSRISPNNAKEVNAATSEDNVHGEVVKVVIISRAGSEGLDFKNIRQIHILEPWYNTNRLEQIIGRAVRTCSHKKLELKERNVEIRMYGTLLPDRREAVDLYVYRMAERKAIRIGRVSRIIKENAVDCFLNSNQSKMTEKEMNQQLLIELSSGSKILYKVGDKPYSAVCDYMADCNYSCKGKCDLDKVNIDTYGETFMVMNMDKIISKIRMLMKENYVYKKDELVAHINYKKKYPIEQINMALEQLVTDKNEIITDVLGRIGNLINIQDYYLFQPVEIIDEKISPYERNRPLDYKRKHIRLEFKKHEEVEFKKKKDIQAILNFLTNEYELIKDGEEKNKEWAARASVVINSMEIDKKTLTKYAFKHVLDIMNFQNKLQLANYIYIKKDLNEMEKLAKDYFNQCMIEDSLMILYKDKILNFKWNNKKWQPLTELENMEIDSKKTRRVENIKKNMSSVVGIIDVLKNDLVFKIKTINQKYGKKGLVCHQITKRQVIKNLNTLIGKQKYTMENTKIKKGEGKRAIDLCIEQELLLRHFSSTKKNGKIWFLVSVDNALCKN